MASLFRSPPLPPSARSPRPPAVEKKGEVEDFAVPEHTPGSSVLPSPPTEAKSGRFLRDDGLNGVMPMAFPPGKEFKAIIGGSYQVATNGVGVVSEVISNDLVAATAEFVRYAGLFDEFFVQRFIASYQPVSRYQKPVTVSAVETDLPLSVVSLHHGRAAYTTHTDSCNNSAQLVCNTADPWKYTWKNIEKRKSAVAPVSGTTTSPTQAWCLTDASSAALYQGRAQLISPSAFTGTSVALLGTVVVKWELYFRCRT